MALPTIRHASVFVNSRKIGECFKSTTSLESGDERAFGDAGVSGFTDGAVTTELDFDTIVPMSGMAVDLANALLGKQNVEIQTGVIDGKIWSIEMRFQSAKYESDAVKGSLNGSFKLIGGQPTIV